MGSRYIGQHKDKPKSVNTNQMEADLGETESVSKSCLKQDAKISAQSSQIQNLCNKLDAAGGGKLTNA